MTRLLSGQTSGTLLFLKHEEMCRQFLTQIVVNARATKKIPEASER
jgi:hypothetical protein